MPVSSVGHLPARSRRWRRLLPEHKGTELAQKPVVITLGDCTGPTAQLRIDGFAYKLLDDTPSHIDVTAVFDELALEHALERGVGHCLRQPLHPPQFEDLRAKVQ